MSLTESPPPGATFTPAHRHLFDPGDKIGYLTVYKYLYTYKHKQVYQLVCKCSRVLVRRRDARNRRYHPSIPGSIPPSCGCARRKRPLPATTKRGRQRQEKQRHEDQIAQLQNTLTAITDPVQVKKIQRKIAKLQLSIRKKNLKPWHLADRPLAPIDLRRAKRAERKARTDTYLILATERRAILEKINTLKNDRLDLQAKAELLQQKKSAKQEIIITLRRDMRELRTYRAIPSPNITPTQRAEERANYNAAIEAKRSGMQEQIKQWESEISEINSQLDGINQKILAVNIEALDLKSQLEKLKLRKSSPKAHLRKEYARVTKYRDEEFNYVCPSWATFEGFAADQVIQNVPSSKHKLRRLNRLYGFTPGNVVWRTDEEHNQLLLQDRMLTLYGKTQSLLDWCKEYGVTATRYLFLAKKNTSMSQIFKIKLTLP